MKKIILLSAFVASLFYSASANAQLIDIQFNGYPATQHYSGAVQVGAVQVGATNDYWNIQTGLNATNFTLKDTNKNDSGIKFTYTSTGVGNDDPANNTFVTPILKSEANLANDYISTKPGVGSFFKFSGLTQGATYTLYVYSQGSLGSTNGLKINGSQVTSGNANHNVFDSTNSYVTTFIASGSEQIFTYDALGTGSRSRGIINGLQLSAPAPEPSSAALVGIGVLFLVAFKLKKSGALSVFNV